MWHRHPKAAVGADLARQTLLPCCGEKPEGTEHTVLWAGAQAEAARASWLTIAWHELKISPVSVLHFITLPSVSGLARTAESL